MSIPHISEIIPGIREWRRRSMLKKELREELHELGVCNCFGAYEEGQDYDFVYASIEKDYIARGLTKEEIKKVDESITTITIIGG